MKTVRLIATILFYLSRLGAVAVLATAVYASVILLLHYTTGANNLPIKIEEGHFTIYYPFTHQAFLLGDYTSVYLFSNLVIVVFYGVFLWLLSGVFHAFKQKKLFTPKGVAQLSRFYITNLIVPFLFFLLFLIFKNEMSDLIRIIFLHLVIGVFAFFMAALFKQGLVLQEEQDLTF
jgi:hypothetical protein